MAAQFGEQCFDDFNEFQTQVNQKLKTLGLKPSATAKKAILNAVSVYDENAAKMVAKKHQLSGDKLAALLAHLRCEVEDLPYFGYYPSDKAGEYLSYEPSSDLRDTESIALKETILDYFFAEVKPHVAEAWIKLDSVKIGYEISFNKYFYRHKALRDMETVAKEILALESEAEGLIAEILA